MHRVVQEYLYRPACGIQGTSQLLRVSSSCVETLDTHGGDVIRSYSFSDVLEYHAVTVPADRLAAFRLEFMYDEKI